MQRDRSSKLTQSYLINQETKQAVIPIMRNASSMLEFVLQKEGWSICRDKLTDDWTYYTVWRDPYQRFISSLHRELCEVYDKNLHRKDAAIEQQMIKWSNNPELMLELDHTLSQFDTCEGIVPQNCNLHVYSYEAIELMLFDVTGKQYDNTPIINASIDYPKWIVSLWQGDTVYTREPLWMSGWCRKEYGRDYETWEKLLKADTLSIIETY